MFEVLTTFPVKFYFHNFMATEKQSNKQKGEKNEIIA